MHFGAFENHPFVEWVSAKLTWPNSLFHNLSYPPPQNGSAQTAFRFAIF